MAAKKFKNLTGAGIMEEDESKGVKSMSEKLESMFPCYDGMDVLFGHKPNVTPILSYDSQEKDSLNGDDDVDVLLDKENNGLESPLNLVPLLHNEDDLVQVENFQDESQIKYITHSIQKRNKALTPNLNDKSGSRNRPMDMFAPTYANLLESQQKAHETSENACFEWDRERWNKEKAINMEKQRFEEVKLQNQHTKKYEFEKEKWNWELKLKENKCQMDLTIAALSSSRPIAELEQILTLINEK
ncbi:hypothetical protein O181_118424 [Austropuccinia psidii MF-1]|uniref:Uncharacterized protein n=1 Tax=Austropuccinia psidii MF-1 TaxID=1389203 RepID=A0A9Q3KF99_9BASI|nr:hypothetical protein [Austropuccinia psidii MF-1]